MSNADLTSQQTSKQKKKKNIKAGKVSRLSPHVLHQRQQQQKKKKTRLHYALKEALDPYDVDSQPSVMILLKSSKLSFPSPSASASLIISKACSEVNGQPSLPITSLRFGTVM